jgi:DNA polymerase
VILTLGNTPLKAVYQLAGQKPPVIGAVHGAEQALCIGKMQVILIPLYHPASGIYNRSLIEVMEQDAKTAGETIRKKN